MSRCEAWVLSLVSRGVETTRARSDFGLKTTSGEEFHQTFIYYSTQRNNEITSATFCKSWQCFNSVCVVCVCFGHVAVMPPSSTSSLVLTGHQMLLLVLINKIILELFSLRDILCGVYACVSFKALGARSDAGQWHSHGSLCVKYVLSHLNKDVC